jgi:hypothetical protein
MKFVEKYRYYNHTRFLLNERKPIPILYTFILHLILRVSTINIHLFSNKSIILSQNTQLVFYQKNLDRSDL